MALNELKEAFIKALKLRGYKDSTIKGVKSHLKIFYDYLKANGITDKTAINRKILFDFQTYLTGLSDDAGLNKYNIRYRGCILNTIRNFLKVNYELNYMSVDLSCFVENPKVPDRITKNIMSIKEIKTFFDKMKIETVYDFMMKIFCIILYGTGIRINEAIKIKLDDIDFTEMTIEIDDTKRGEKRLAVFGEAIKEYIEFFIKHIRPKLLKLKDSPYLFPSYAGNLVSEEIVNRYIQRFCNDAGIEKKITSHCFRHSYCSHLLSNGLGVREIAELVGHKNLDVTAGYARVVNEDLLEVIKKNHPRERIKDRLL